METVEVPRATLEKLMELLNVDEFLNSNDLSDKDPITQLLILALHQREMIEYQNQFIDQTRDKQLMIIDYLKKLDTKYPKEKVGVLVKQLEQDFEGESDNEQSEQNYGQESKEENKNDNENYKAIQDYHDVEHSYVHNKTSSPSAINKTSGLDENRPNESKVQIDQVLAKIAHNEDDDINLLDNPDKGEIEPLKDPVTHTYTYREISSILREQQHTITDFMYKLFLVSINFAKVRQTKSYTVFKSLLQRVRINS